MSIPAKTIVAEVYTGLPVSVLLTADGSVIVSVDLSETTEDPTEEEGNIELLQEALDDRPVWLTVISKKDTANWEHLPSNTI